ncbi:MAG: hypothetical protein Q8P67_11770, partial [archaeon]|nr:hypothetical protein [archaeon]
MLKFLYDLVLLFPSPSFFSFLVFILIFEKSANSLHSIYMASQRVLMMAELNKIRTLVGAELFPVIDQNYYSRAADMTIGPQFPAVLKISAAHAGFGKTICQDHHHWADLRSVVAVTPHYTTAEVLLDGEYDLRIQRIAAGPGQETNYRVMRRISISGNWKTNTGTSMVDIIPLTPSFKLWADLAAQIFGGLDICAVDVIHDRKSGRDFILEVNDTAIGLHPDTEIYETDSGL